jgi:hypothetical protein
VLPISCAVPRAERDGRAHQIDHLGRDVVLGVGDVGAQRLHRRGADDDRRRALDHRYRCRIILPQVDTDIVRRIVRSDDDAMPARDILAPLMRGGMMSGPGEAVGAGNFGDIGAAR